MSLYDYRAAMKLRDEDVPFYALIMAAMLKADSDNIERLRRAYPEIWAEVEKRYHSRLVLNGQLGALREDSE